MHPKYSERLRTRARIDDRIIIYVMRSSGNCELSEIIPKLRKPEIGYRGLRTQRGLKVRGLSLVVADRNEEERAEKVLKETYPELKVEIWYVDKVEELRDTLSKYKDEVRIKPKLTRNVAPGFDHEIVKGWLVEIGELLGYYVRTEFESGGYRFDVVWWGSERDFKGKKHPAAVFEVQRGGSLVEALARLKHALDRWNIYGLYLVVTEEEDVERARRLVGPHLKGSFHKLQGRLRIYTASRVRKIRDPLIKYKNEITELSKLREQ